MKRLVPLIMLSASLLAGCGGGGGSSSNGSNTGGTTPPPPDQQTNSVVATWFYEYPNQCVETFEFYADGSFEIHSAEAFIAGSYEFDSTVEEGNRHSLVLNFEQQNQEYDCENAYEYAVGSTIELFADFSNSLQMDWYELNTGGDVLFELQRAVSLTVSSLPQSVQAGSPVTFTVSPDIDLSTPISLLYGPSGMEVSESGEVTWTPSIPMINPQTTVSFAFTAERVLAPEQQQVTVTHADFTAPTMRKGIEVAYTSNGIQVANVIGDNNNEMVILDRTGTLSVIAAKGDGYESVFTYPYAFSGEDGMTRMALFDTDGDGMSEAFVASGSNVYHVKDMNLPPVAVFESDDIITHMLLENIDSDAAPELIIATGQYGANHNVFVYDNNLQTELLSLTTEESYNFEMTVGNVDSDASLELVLSSGEIYDINTGDRQWYYADGFGRVLTTGDINNDGIDEVLASSGWSALTVWDIENSTQIVSIDNEDNCSVITHNLDSDPAEEIILGDCQWGGIHGFDITGNTYTELWTLDMVDHENIGLTAGDIDNDGEDELMWGTGTGSTGEDKLVVAELSPTPYVDWYNENPSQLDYFTAAGWAQIAPGESAAVYVIPSTDSGYEGQRYATMTSDGDVFVSEEISSNWEQHGYATIGNINGDEYDELFLLGADFYSPRIDVIELDSGIALWQLDSNNTDMSVSAVAVADVNGDGFDDVLYADKEMLYIQDVSNNQILGTWATGAHIEAVAVTTDSGNNTVVLVNTYEAVLVLSFNNGQLGLRASSNSEDGGACYNMLARPMTDSFLCVGDGYYSSNILKMSLEAEVIANVQVQGAITDAILAPDSDNIIVAFTDNDDYWGAASTSIAEVDSDTGIVIWRGTSLPGMLDRHGLSHGNPDSPNMSLVIGSRAGMILTH